ncbi:flippase [Patescibacteria group bacterium]|nr:flippase [Patescibacteria group bacterium]
MSHARALAVNTGVQLIGKAISTVFGIFAIGLLTRLLGQEGFGLYTAANSYLQIFALALDLGINVTFTALLGEHAGDEAYEKRCVSALFTLRFLMASIVLIGSPLLWWLIYPQEHVMLLAIIALTGSVFFPALSQILIGLQQRHMRMHVPAIAEVIARTVLLGGLLLGIWLNLPALSLLWLVSLASVASFLWTLAFARPRGRIYWNWDPSFWIQTLQRSWPVGISIAFNLVYFKADSLILSRVRPLSEVGIYGAAYRVLEILITVPFMYAGILLPLLSEVWGQKDRARFSIYISRSLEAMLYLTCPLLVGTILLGPRLMTLVAGPEFVDSGRILRILILAVAVIYLNTITSHVIVALNKQRAMLPLYIIVAIATLTGYVVFIPRFGMWAAAWLTFASEAAIFCGSYTVTHRASPFTLNLRTVFATIAASLCMGGVIWACSTLPLGALLVLAIVSYTAALFALGGITPEHLRLLFKRNV